MLQVQRFLNTHKDPYLLTEKLAIKVDEYEHFIVLNYDMVNTPKMDTMSWDCRGLILSRGTWQVLCRPFTRFFNFAETFDTLDFNFEQSFAFEKIDGSLMSVWWNPFFKRWNVSTRKMAFAEGTTSFGDRFSDIFCTAIGGEVDKMFAKFNKDYTYIHEMVSPQTRVVKAYPKEAAYFLAARHNLSGAYLMHNDYIEEMYSGMNMLYPQQYYFSTPDEMKMSMDELPPLDEGYVVYDPTTGNRVKVKNPSYVAIHYMRGSGQLTPKNITILAFKNETDEYLSYFPEDRALVDPYKESYEKLMREIDKYWNLYGDIQSRKKFAKIIDHLKVKHILFEIKNGRTKEDIFDKMYDHIKVDLLEYYHPTRGSK